MTETDIARVHEDSATLSQPEAKVISLKAAVVKIYNPSLVSLLGEI